VVLLNCDGRSWASQVNVTGSGLFAYFQFCEGLVVHLQQQSAVFWLFVRALCRVALGALHFSSPRFVDIKSSNLIEVSFAL